MRRAIPLLAAALLAAPLAGCLENGGDAAPGADAAPKYAFSGAFEGNATQAQMSGFEERVRTHGADDVLFMESFPVQFSARGFASAADCEEARSEVAALAFVQSARECRAIEESANPDEPVSDDA